MNVQYTKSLVDSLDPALLAVFESGRKVDVLKDIEMYRIIEREETVIPQQRQKFVTNWTGTVAIALMIIAWGVVPVYVISQEGWGQGDTMGIMFLGLFLSGGILKFLENKLESYAEKKFPYLSLSHSRGGKMEIEGRLQRFEEVAQLLVRVIPAHQRPQGGISSESLEGLLVGLATSVLASEKALDAEFAGGRKKISTKDLRLLCDVELNMLALIEGLRKCASAFGVVFTDKELYAKAK